MLKRFIFEQKFLHQIISKVHNIYVSMKQRYHHIIDVVLTCKAFDGLINVRIHFYLFIDTFIYRFNFTR